jgi:hypothetical protein
LRVMAHHEDCLQFPESITSPEIHPDKSDCTHMLLSRKG